MTTTRVKGVPMDPEVIALVDALNTIPGLVTTGSCSGHGTVGVRVSFTATPAARAELQRLLPPFRRYRSNKATLRRNWRLNDRGLYGPVDDAFAASDALAGAITRTTRARRLP